MSIIRKHFRNIKRIWFIGCHDNVQGLFWLYCEFENTNSIFNQQWSAQAINDVSALAIYVVMYARNVALGEFQ